MDDKLKSDPKLERVTAAPTPPSRMTAQAPDGARTNVGPDALDALLRGSNVRPYLAQQRVGREPEHGRNEPRLNHSESRQSLSADMDGATGPTAHRADRLPLVGSDASGISITENAPTAMFERASDPAAGSGSVPAAAVIAERDSSARPAERQMYEVPLCEISIFDQPRRDMGDVEALARDIAANGQQTPILLAPNPHWKPNLDGQPMRRWVLVAGHRRFAALQTLNRRSQGRAHDHIIGEIRGLDSVAVVLARIGENEARLDLSPVERAWEMVALQEVLNRAKRPHTLEALRELLPGRPSLGTLSNYLQIGRTVTPAVLAEAGFLLVDEETPSLQVVLSGSSWRQESQIDWQRVREEVTLTVLADASRRKTPRDIAARLQELAGRRRSSALAAQRRAELRSARAAERDASLSTAPVAGIAQTPEEVGAGPESAERATDSRRKADGTPLTTAAQLLRNGGFRKNLSRPFELLDSFEASQHMCDLSEAAAALATQMAPGRYYVRVPAGAGDLILFAKRFETLETREEIETAKFLLASLNRRIQDAARKLGMEGAVPARDHMTPAARAEHDALTTELAELRKRVGPLRAAEGRASAKSPAAFTTFEKGAKRALQATETRLAEVERRLKSLERHPFQ